MASDNNEQTSRVKFDLDDSEHNDELLDEFQEGSTHTNNPSSSVNDSNTNKTKNPTKVLSNSDNKSTTKRYSR